MNNNKPGISILACVLLTSSFLLICTGVWKTTVYLVDFAVQKQVYIQNRYIIEGIMRLIIKDVTSNWDELEHILQQRNNEIIYTIESLPTMIEHLKNCAANITIQRHISDIMIKVALLNDEVLLNAQCNLTRALDQHSFRVHDWYVGV